MLSTINLRKLITSLIPSYLTGFLGWFFTRNSMDVYGKLVSPPLSPPGWLFPIAWIILYTLMGISLYLVRESSANSGEKRRAYIIYAMQLVFNFLWSVLFFRFGFYGFSAVWLGALIILIALNILYFGQINTAAAWLLVPYLLWCAFALYLNIGIYILN